MTQSVKLLLVLFLFSKSLPAQAADISAIQQKLTSNPIVDSLGLGDLNLDIAGEGATISGQFQLSLQLPGELGGKKLNFAGDVTVHEVDSDSPTFEFKTVKGKEISFVDAFGLKFLDLTKVGLHLKIQGKEAEISLEGLFNKKTVTVDFATQEGKVTDFIVHLPDPLKLSSLPGIKELPGAKEFTLSDIAVSMDAVKGSTSFRGETVETVIFKGLSGKWNQALAFHGSHSLGEIVKHNKGILKQLKIPSLHLIISKSGLHADIDELPLVAQEYFEGHRESISIGSGVSVYGDFDPQAMPKDLKTGLSQIGIQEKIPLMGTVEGVFGGSPGFELDAELSQSPNHGFSFLKKVKAKEHFFLRLHKSEIALGFRTQVELPGKKGKEGMIFDTDIMVQMEGVHVEVALVGSMTGTWSNAIGIKGFDIINPSLQVGITETGSFDMAIDGTFHAGKETVEVAADLVISPGAAFLPTALAFAGTVNVLSFSDVAKLTGQMMGKKNFKAFKGFKAELREVHFLVMTPGAHLPDDLADKYHLVGAGFAMGAQLWVNKKELAEADGYFSDEGIGFDGKVAPFTLGPLKLKDAELDIQAGVDSPPEFLVKGEFELFKGFKEKYQIEIAENHLELYTDTKFGGLFEVELLAKTTDGLKLTPDNDLTFDSAVKADASKAFLAATKAAAKGLEKNDKELKKAEASLKKKEDDVKKLDSDIKKAQDQAKKDYDAAKKKLESAKKKIEPLKKKYESLKHKAHDLKKDIKKAKKKVQLGKAAKKGVELAGVETALGTVYASYKAAKKTLEAAEKATKGVVRGMNPKVRSLQVARETALAGLKVAEGSVAAARAINHGVEKAVEAIDKGLKVFEVKEIRVSGSIQGVKSLGKRGKAPRVKVVVKIDKKTHNYSIAIDNKTKDFEKLAQHTAEEVAKELVNFFKNKG